MQHWTRLLRRLGRVHAFDYPYILAGHRRPDPHGKLVGAHQAAAKRAQDDNPRDALVLIGKSMGARIGCHVALEQHVDALVCLGYPLIASRTGAVRDAVLLAQSQPILFVQGSRDRLCPLARLRDTLAEMRAPTELFVVEGGDHSLQVGKRALAKEGTTQDEIDQRIVEVIAKFLDGCRRHPAAPGPNDRFR